MRIIAGTAKGTRLRAPKGLEVRPTLDRVREALFSILGPRLEGARFLDLFAGTGANGIEALSRGAAACVFVDNEPRALEAIRANLERARVAQRADVRHLTLPAGLMALAGNAGPFDIVFADPPYDYREHAALMDFLWKSSLLAPEGLIVVEHPVRRPVDATAAAYKWKRTALYGDTALSFYS